MKLQSDKAWENNIIIWQEDSQDMPEQAILIERFDSNVSISQNGAVINLNYDACKDIGNYIAKIKRPQ